MSEQTNDVSTNQNKIWDHFQNEDKESFSGCSPRLDFLIKKINSISKGKKNISVLNIGAGSGYFEIRSMQSGHLISSLDLSQKTVDSLKSKGVDAHCGDITAMSFPDGHFDFVVASEVLEHLSDADRPKAFNEINRILKKDALFIGTVPFNEVLLDNKVICPSCENVFHRWGHQKSFTLESFSSEASTKMTPLKITRKVFVDFTRAGFSAKFKSLAKLLIGLMGSSIAAPNIYFELQKKNS